ncbi:Defensin J1-1 [Capsicum annuum]|nr:Defensin J1-1 [Capsicum annuum]
MLKPWNTTDMGCGACCGGTVSPVTRGLGFKPWGWSRRQGLVSRRAIGSRVCASVRATVVPFATPRALTEATAVAFAAVASALDTVKLISLINFLDRYMMAEAKICEALSGNFKGLCLSSRDCGNVCRREGFTSGVCRGFPLKCFCRKPGA